MTWSIEGEPVPSSDTSEPMHRELTADATGSDVAAVRTELARFGIDLLEANPFRTLSGGEAQHLRRAPATVSASQLLLVDEPTAQLDTTSAHGVSVNPTELAGDHRIVVIATHDPRVTAACGSRWDLAG